MINLSIPSPPGIAVNVLIGRRDLDATESLGAEDLLALGGDGVPRPLEQVHNDLLVVAEELTEALESK